MPENESEAGLDIFFTSFSDRTIPEELASME